MKKLTTLILLLLCLTAAAQETARKGRPDTDKSSESSPPEAPVKVFLPKEISDTTSQKTAARSSLKSDWFLYYTDNRAVIKRDSLYGYVDCNGVEVIPCRYKKAYHFRDGIALVRQGYEVFAIDTLGNRLDLRVKIPQFRNRDFENYVYWVWRNIPFASSEELRRMKDERVYALITVGADGRVTDCKNISSTSDEAFGRVRDVAITSPQWSPGQIGGQPVSTDYLLPVEFYKLRTLKCYPVTAHGARIDRDFTYPLFEGQYAVTSFGPWFYKHLRFRNADEYYRAGTGVVRVAFTVDTKGRLRDITILRAHNDVCSAKTVEILKRSPRWTPGTIDGKPVNVRYETSFKFNFR